ncbi:MAG: family 43 glycosylhydrolase, partial [Planctomycetes bacterium]|nr:family 43 glycosylhydrolase [Planctomycetota bacterium]
MPNRMAIGVAVSDGPLGPWKDPIGKPLVSWLDVFGDQKAGQEVIDPHVFTDDDGSVYWVFGGGWIARMKDDMTGLGEKPRLIRPHDERNDVGPGGQILQVGQAGAFLFKKDGKYHMVAAGIHGRIGVPCYDTFVAVADSLEGPWSRRLVAVAHGGQTTMFEGPESQWYSTFSGIDSRAALRDRPAIVPVNWVDSITYYSPKNLTWPLKPAHIITEAWGWENARPLLDLGFRDIGIVNGRDGYFYFSGLHGDNRLNMANVFCRGKDLTGAEPWDLVQFPGLEVVTDLPWYEYFPQKTDGWNNLRMSSCKLFDVNGIFYATVSAAKHCGILRSTSETMRGPWEVAKQKPYGTIRGSGHIKTDMQGDLWLALRSHLWPVTPDFEFDLDREVSGKDGYVPSRSRSNSYAVEIADGSSPIRGDVGRYFYKIDGKYMMLGTAWHGNYRGFGTYDNQVFWADDLIGPWHHSRAVLPHGGHAGLVKDNDGQWWSTSFCNDPFA